MEFNDNINFILPGFLNVSRNELLIYIYEKYPNITMENSCIHSFYGNFPSCIWNGGRLCLGERYSIKQMKKIKNFHNKHGVAIALTMTNLLLEEKHLDDKYANDIMNIFHDGFNEVLISTACLDKYIRVNYPNFKINKSITSRDNPLLTLDKYNLSLIPSQYSNDDSYISNIPINLRRNVEILCNDPCMTNCKWKYKHYEELCNLQLGNIKRKKDDLYGNCKQKNNSHNFFANTRNEKLYLPPNNIPYIFEKYKIKYFKINGREKYEYYGYDNIIEFCVKDEYKFDVLCFMIERMIVEFSKDIFYQNNKFGFYIKECDNSWHERLGTNVTR